MSEFTIPLEHHSKFANSSIQTNNNRFLNDDEPTRHPVSFPAGNNTNKLRPAISTNSIHKPSQNYVQDDMVLLHNARSSVFNQSLSTARSVNDLDQLPSAVLSPAASAVSTSQHHLAQHTLPAYRAAPDYETAMRNKLGITQPPQPSLWTTAAATAAATAAQPQQSQQQTYSLHEDQFHTVSPQQNLPTVSSFYSTSTPELNRINMTHHSHSHQLQNHQLQNQQGYPMPTQDQIVAELQRLNLYKPPPPYPGTNANGQHQHIINANGSETRMISSTSTPDLASTNIMSAMNATHSGVLLGGSSPDLVSRKNLGRMANHKETTLHKTMDNLHNFMEQQQQQQQQQQQMQYDEEAKLDQVGGFSQQVSFSSQYTRAKNDSFQ